jgi:hypothetical protein
MGKVRARTSKGGSGLPLDMLLPTLIGLMAIFSIIGADIAIEAKVLADTDVDDDEPDVPVPRQTVEIETTSVNGWTEEGFTTDIQLGELPGKTTMIRAELRWQDDYGDNDVFGLAIMHNDTEVISVDDGSGEIVLETEEGLYIGSHGVRITAVRCPGMVDRPLSDMDDGNDWSLKVVATAEIEG